MFWYIAIIKYSLSITYRDSIVEMVAFKLWMVVTIALHMCHIAMSTHFRGGIVQWRPVDPINFDGRVIVLVAFSNIMHIARDIIL